MSLSYRSAVKFLGSYWNGGGLLGGLRRARGGKAKGGRAAWFEFLEERMMYSVSPVLSDINKTEPLHATSEGVTFLDFRAAFVDSNSGSSIQTLTITSLPTHGHLTFSVGNVTVGQTLDLTLLAVFPLTYIQDAGYTGTDSFTWNASDSSDPNNPNFAVNPGNITISIPTNTAPVVSDVSPHVGENQSKTFVLNDFAPGFSDADVGDSLAVIKITSLPANGTLKLGNATVNAGDTVALAQLGNLTYTPDTNFVGNDTFTWNGSDGFNFASADATATLVVENPAVGNVTKIEAAHGTLLNFVKTDFTNAFANAGNNSVTAVEIVTLPAHGTLTLNNAAVTPEQIISIDDVPNLIYTQNPAGFTGSDSFTWNGTNDGSAFAPDAANVFITVKPNTPPVLGTTNLFSVVEGRPFQFVTGNFTSTTLFTDADVGDSLASIKIVTLPFNGTLTLGNVTINTPGTIIPAAQLGTLVYTPNDATFQGTDAFAFNASDGFDFATLDSSINLVVANTKPTVSNVTIPVFQSAGNTTFTTANFTPGFHDVDVGDTLGKIQIVTLPTHGNLTFNGSPVTVNEQIDAAAIATLVYIPNVGTTGNDTFTYSVSDGKDFAGTGNVGNVTLSTATVTLAPTAPTEGNFTFAVTPNNSANFTLGNFTSTFADTVSGGALTSITITSRPAHGTLFLNGVAVTLNQTILVGDIGNLTITPTANFIGADTFTIKVSDQGGLSTSNTTVTLGIDTPPQAGNISRPEAVKATSLTFTKADFIGAFSDTDGNSLVSIKIVTLPTHGTLKLNNIAVTAGQVIQVSQIPLLVYAQTAGFVGDSTFTYQNSDGVLFSGGNTSGGGNHDGNGTVTVTSQNTPPTVSNVTLTTAENITLTLAAGNFTGSFTDPDTGSSMTSITLVTLPSHGDLFLTSTTGNTTSTNKIIITDLPLIVLAADIGNITYKPTPGTSGADSFTWKATDNGAGNTAATSTLAATVNISVTAPSFSTTEALHDSSATLTLSQFQGAFTGSGNLTFIQINALPANGTLKLITNNGSGNVTGNAITSPTGNISTAGLVGILYTQQGGFSGSDSFTWMGTDGTSVVGGARALLTVPTDTAPTVTGFSATVAANNTPVVGNVTNPFAHPFTIANFTTGFTDPDSVSGTADSLFSIRVTALPKHGKLKLTQTNGNSTLTSDVTINQVIQKSDLAGLTFAPDAGFTGTDTFAYTGSDSTLSSLNPGTVTLSVLPPAIGNVTLSTTPGANITFAAGNFTAVFTATDTDSLTISGNATTDSLVSIKITSLPAHGKLRLGVANVTLNQVISLADIGNLVFTPTAGYHGNDTFTWAGADLFSGNIPVFSAKANVNLTIDTPPSLGATATIPITLNVTRTFKATDFTSPFSDTDNDKLKFIEFTTLPLNGTINLNGIPVELNQVVSVNDLGKLTYIPGTAGMDTFTWTASDGFTFASSVGITNLNVNAPPVVSTVNKTVATGSSLTFAPADFNSATFTDTDSGDSLQFIKITALPAHGTLKLNGVAVKVNQIINVVDDATGGLANLIYTPTSNFVGSDSFKFLGSDGKDFSVAPASVVLAIPSIFGVLGNSTPIVNNSKTPSLANFTDFGNWTTNADASMHPDVRTFTIQNFGNTTINLGNVTLSNGADFTATLPIVTTLNAGDSTTFTIEFNPTTVGKRTSNVTISAGDNSVLYTFMVQGNAVHTTNVTTVATQNSGGGNVDVTGLVQVGTTQNGSGVGASNGQIISIVYTGYLTNGTVFDSTTIEGGKPITFRLDDLMQLTSSNTTPQPYLNNDQTGDYNQVDFSVIAGWEYGLQGIKVGEKRIFIINSSAGYGASGSPPHIPGNATLIFEVQCAALSTVPQLGVAGTDSNGNITSSSYIQPGQTTFKTGDNTLFTLGTTGDSSVAKTYDLLTSGTVDITGAGIGTWTFKTGGLTITGDTKDFSIGLSSARTMVINFHPLSAGTHFATVHIKTTDPLHPDFTFNIEGIAAPYVDMFMEFNKPHFPTTAVVAGSTQTVTVPVVIKNIGDIAVPANSKTNVQVYALNTSTNVRTLIKLINNVDISGLGAGIFREMDQTVTLPAVLPSGSYEFTAVVNADRTQDESATDPTLATVPEAAAFNDAATLTTGSITVVQGTRTLTGNLVSSTLAPGAASVSGNVTFSLKNTGTIPLPAGEQATVTIIARSTSATDPSPDVMLLAPSSSSLISISQLGSSAKSFSIPVNFGLKMADGSYDIIVLITPVQSITGIGQLTLDADAKGNPLGLNVFLSAT